MNTETWLCGPPPSTGQRQQYPSRFEKNLFETYPELQEESVLHMFSGACEWGDTTDVREETRADIVAPFDDLPEIGPYDAVVADPPYNAGFATEWDEELPRPKHVADAARGVLRDGGRLFLLHILILPAYKELGLERLALHPILCGPNNVIRVLNVLRVHKDE